MSATADPRYPGNPSLPREVRDKILSTFRHTLNLFKESKIDDCLIGCDFILKMDPRFTPARQLMEKAKNPAADVDLAILETVVSETPTRQERVASAETDRLLVRAAESLNARDFEAAIAAAEGVLKVLPGNHDATEILEKARRKRDSQPQFEVARQRAMAALDGHRMGEAKAALDKMRSLDAEHPAVSLLERRLVVPAPAEIGESTNPGFAPPAPAPAPEPAPETASGSALDDLSLDSLSLDDSASAVMPPTDFRQPMFGPLGGSHESPSVPSAGDDFLGGNAQVPPDLWSSGPSEEAEPDRFSLEAAAGSAFSAEPSTTFSSTPSAASFAAPEPLAEPEPPSQQEEIQSLLSQGDEAVRVGKRQQAIEIWSRIFLIDINNAEAAGRIEKTRQEMAEGSRRLSEGLRKGRERFEAGDFTGAREAFLEVLAADETDATARSYLDRIEQELARPSAGLDLSRKSPQGDILAEEMAETAEPEAPPPAVKAKTATVVEAAPRRPLDKRFMIALGGALVLTIAVGAYYLLRGGPGKTPSASGGGASLEHATLLFREGKLTETIAELRQIPAEHPDYARAQKLLASLTRKPGDASAPAAPAEGGAPQEPPKPEGGPSADAVRLRTEGEKALAEKRYIDALKNFNLAAPAFQSDPTFAQSLGAASEKVAELTPAVKLYNEGEYETAVPILWRIFQADRSNQDARSYLLRSYYNQGIGQLQNGLYPKAVESFDEVLSIDSEDADAIRHKKFAQRYLKGDLDLMGRIYVRHIQQRP